ncbi:hypothetical protein PHJA_001871500 [Phtheirospermum japonicum]|uniref:Uncharacterized protein n=1 Tax=Phtheirospermum japonicum TaxID=374723 RepID=A0A830CM62_9LAMI|nr:hypothetical protein PHJA_001871500 [Phtheirospermum japonicum]
MTLQRETAAKCAKMFAKKAPLIHYDRASPPISDRKRREKLSEKSSSFHDKGGMVAAEMLPRSRTLPDLLTESSGEDVTALVMHPKLTMLLLNVTIQRSLGAVREVMPLEATAEAFDHADLEATVEAASPTSIANLTNLPQPPAALHQTLYCLRRHPALRRPIRSNAADMRSNPRPWMIRCQPPPPPLLFTARTRRFQSPNVTRSFSTCPFTEKARLQIEAKAAKEARKKAEVEAGAEAKRKRELEREAARQAFSEGFCSDDQTNSSVNVMENDDDDSDICNEVFSAMNPQLPPQYPRKNVGQGCNRFVSSGAGKNYGLNSCEAK